MKRAFALALAVMVLTPIIYPAFRIEFPNYVNSKQSITSMIPAQPSTAPIPVSTCSALDTPGATYVVTNNIAGGGVAAGTGIDSCIFIAGDGVTLNLNGFKIDGTSNTIVVKASHSEIEGPGTITALPFGPAITIVNGSSNQVRGVTLTLSFLGVNILNSNKNVIEGNTITNIGVYGIRVLNGTQNIITRNKITSSGLLVPTALKGAAIALQDATLSFITGNQVNGNGNGLIIDKQSIRTIVALNHFSRNNQSGIVAFSGPSLILGNHADNNGINGIALVGSSNILAFNTANDNLQRGIGLGNVCSASGASLPSGSNNKIIANTARENPVDFFWDQQGTRNLWAFDSNDMQPIPTTPPTAPLQCTVVESLGLDSNVFNSDNNASLYIRNNGVYPVQFVSYYVKDPAGNQYANLAYSGPTISPGTVANANVVIGSSCTNCTLSGTPFTFALGGSYTMVFVTARNNQFWFTIIR